MKKLGQHSALGCFAIFWSLITLAFDGFIAYSVYHQIRSESYPSTPGRILESEVTSSTDSDGGTTYGIKVKFEYEVAGKLYVGDKERYGSISTSDRSRARDFVKAHPPGKEVTVYYNPHDHADAVLIIGLDSMQLFMALFMTPFNLVMLFVWCVLGRSLLHKYRPAEAGGVPILRRAYGVHLRLPQHSPLGCAAVTAGGVAFIGIFVVAFGFSMGNSMLPVLVMWGLVLGTFLVVYLKLRFQAGAGLNDLIIDLENHEFSLPQTFDRDGDQTYPLDWIDDVTLETRIQSGSKGGSTTYYVPTLNFTDENGNRHAEKLGEWFNEEPARSLVDWLNQRISRAAREIRAEV